MVQNATGQYYSCDFLVCTAVLLFLFIFRSPVSLKTTDNNTHLIKTIYIFTPNMKKGMTRVIPFSIRMAVINRKEPFSVA